MFPLAHRNGLLIMCYTALNPNLRNNIARTQNDSIRHPQRDPNNNPPIKILFCIVPF